MCVIKLHAFIYFLRPPPWSGTVSLPWEWFQEIKHMRAVHSTHGLFFNCTQCTINRYLHDVQAIDNQPVAEIIRNQNLLGGPVSCSWWQIPIHSGPLPGSNYPILWLLPLSHSLNPHYTIYTDDMNNYSFFVRDKYFRVLCQISE
jgi:hypothetical protein